MFAGSWLWSYPPNTCDILFLELFSPCIKRDLISFHINEYVYLASLEECKNHLHAIILSKCEKPLNNIDVCKKLDLASWKVIPMGKGFYEFVFSFL